MLFNRVPKRAAKLFLDRVRPNAERKWPALRDGKSFLFASLRCEGRPISLRYAISSVLLNIAGVFMGCNLLRSLMNTTCATLFLEGKIDARQSKATVDVSFITSIFNISLVFFYNVIGRWSSPEYCGSALYDSRNE